VRVVDGKGNEYTVLIYKDGYSYAEGKIVDKRRKPNEIPFYLTLGCGILKGERMELLIEKGTEIGSYAFFPLLTERTVVNPGENKVMRWRKIALSAMKQSRRSILPHVYDPMTLHEFCERVYDFDVKILLSERGKSRPKSNLGTVQKVVIVAGPEGSFTDKETEFLRKEGFVEWNLGMRTLRTETALIAGSVLFLYFQREV
jgi:16S rRNA (uracil1498-N3)-methyltransferase